MSLKQAPTGKNLHLTWCFEQVQAMYMCSSVMHWYWIWLFIGPNAL
jgi:hypothetical protein